MSQSNSLEEQGYTTTFKTVPLPNEEPKSTLSDMFQSGVNDLLGFASDNTASLLLLGGSVAGSYQLLKKLDASRSVEGMQADKAKPYDISDNVLSKLNADNSGQNSPEEGSGKETKKLNRKQRKSNSKRGKQLRKQARRKQAQQRTSNAQSKSKSNQAKQGKLGQFLPKVSGQSDELGSKKSGSTKDNQTRQQSSSKKHSKLGGFLDRFKPSNSKGNKGKKSGAFDLLSSHLKQFGTHLSGLNGRFAKLGSILSGFGKKVRSFSFGKKSKDHKSYNKNNNKNTKNSKKSKRWTDKLGLNWNRNKDDTESDKSRKRSWKDKLGLNWNSKKDSGNSDTPSKRNWKDKLGGYWNQGKEKAIAFKDRNKGYFEAGKKAGTRGGALGLVFGGLEAYNVYNDDSLSSGEKAEKMTSTVIKSGLSMSLGGALGAAGTIFGPLGSAAGYMIGSELGSFLGDKVGGLAGSAVKNLFFDEEPTKGSEQPNDQVTPQATKQANSEQVLANQAPEMQEKATSIADTANKVKELTLVYDFAQNTKNFAEVSNLPANGKSPANFSDHASPNKFLSNVNHVGNLAKAYEIFSDDNRSTNDKIAELSGLSANVTASFLANAPFISKHLDKLGPLKEFAIWQGGNQIESRTTNWVRELLKDEPAKSTKADVQVSKGIKQPASNDAIFYSDVQQDNALKEAMGIDVINAPSVLPPLRLDSKKEADVNKTSSSVPFYLSQPQQGNQSTTTVTSTDNFNNQQIATGKEVALTEAKADVTTPTVGNLPLGSLNSTIDKKQPNNSSLNGLNVHQLKPAIQADTSSSSVNVLKEVSKSQVLNEEKQDNVVPFDTQKALLLNDSGQSTSAHSSTADKSVMQPNITINSHIEVNATKTDSPQDLATEIKKVLEQEQEKSIRDASLRYFNHVAL